jgi:transketolase
LRATPNMLVIRPCDANETAEAWRVAMEQKTRPVCFALTRQKVPTFDRKKHNPANGLWRGAYILSDPPGDKVDVILIGTGSEVQLCMQAQAALAKDGIGARVVSMPSWELFEAQDESYRNAVLPPAIIARVSVEAGAVLGWERYVGMTGAMIGMRSFGASGPAPDVYKHFGITAEAVEKAARAQIAKARQA